MTREPTEAQELEAEEELLDAVTEESESINLSSVITELEKIQREKNATKAIGKLKEVLGSLDGDSLEALLQSDLMDSINELAAKGQGSSKPGSPIYDSVGRQIAKVPYTMEYLERTNPIVEWTPTQTKPISYNGITVFVEAYKPVKSPAVFRDIYMESERETALAYNSIPEMHRESGPADGTTVATGWQKLTDEELEKRYGRNT